MTTPRQIKANYHNAQKSTGPRTAAGRAASSKNALKHGLTAQQIVIRDENTEDFEAFYAALYEDYAPVGAREESLTEQIILCEWCRRRPVRIEAGLMSRAVQSAPMGGYAFQQSFQQSLGSLATLSRYETGIARSLQQSRHELERLQARRRGEAVAAPLAVDVSGKVEVSQSAVPSKPSQTLSQCARQIATSEASADPSIQAPLQALQRGN